MTGEEAANELQSYADSSWGGLNKAFEMAIAALREQPRWISVEERLPEHKGAYVVADTREEYIGCWDYEPNERYDWLMDGIIPAKTKEITHWMPLPEAPEVEV